MVGREGEGEGKREEEGKGKGPTFREKRPRPHQSPHLCAPCRNRLSICLSSYSGIINPVETIVRMYVSRYFISIGLCA